MHWSKVAGLGRCTPDLAGSRVDVRLNAFMRELTLELFMAVQTEFGSGRKVPPLDLSVGLFKREDGQLTDLGIGVNGG